MRDLPAKSSCRNGLLPPMASSTLLSWTSWSSCAASACWAWPVQGTVGASKSEELPICLLASAMTALLCFLLHTTAHSYPNHHKTPTQARPTPSSCVWLASSAMQWTLRRDSKARSSGCFASGRKGGSSSLCHSAISHGHTFTPLHTHTHRHTGAP
jgi:hypothetical protein